MLENIKSPQDLKDLSIEELKELAEEIREKIVQTVSTNGGHLASNLGTVDLAIALHYVFNSPVDKIIWDVGHQSYAHKILTGRSERFHTIRRKGGLSGFPSIFESPHDAFGTGHSSTSISAALGMIEARDQRKEKFKVVAVIGDGALTAGLAFEGLNHAGHLKKDLIVVLNDNEMSISPNVGALSQYLRKIMMGALYTKVKKETKFFLERIPGGEPFLKIAQRAEDAVKGFFVPGQLFEELGFEYVGPIDGHRMDLLIETLRRFKDFPSPVLIHVITRKGKGYEPAEKNPDIFHGVGPFDIETGERRGKTIRSYSEVFGRCLTRLASADRRIVAITAAMAQGTGLSEFVKRHPGRFYDVGIAEPHAVTFASGLAIQGMRPVVAIYSTFLQRSYDQIVHDVCLQNLPVVFAIDRAGIVGDDGPTHNGAFDISYLRHVPNLVLMSPKDGAELQRMLKTALIHDGPSAIRYPRGEATDADDIEDPEELEIGRAEVCKEGKDVLIVAIGQSVIPSIEAAEILQKRGISACVINARFVKPLDIELISEYSTKTGHILTVEENAVAGGFGSAIIEGLIEREITDIKMNMIGLPDKFIEHATQSELRKELGLDAEGIAQSVIDLLKNKTHRKNGDCGKNLHITTESEKK